MYTLFTDKTELFECIITLEGANITNSKARLVLESNDLNLLFIGEIDKQGKCVVPIKKLKGILNENTSGTIKLEVIADDTYFTPWESEFNVVTSKKVTVEVKNHSNKNILENSTPKVAVSISNQPTTLTIKEKELIHKTELTIKEHVDIIAQLLKKEKIDVINITENKNKVNKIIGNHLVKYPELNKNKDEIILGIIKKIIY